ncbi:integrin-linked protein kinase 1-like [Camellia sinensis]|uniref:integrin-linked protein kinase 1-like n=1 Tax=Camellia sinensis TaxID=4442 RepID=UPI001035A9E1|nr:integrin-linked protein kinase 1-like [Camellia sinensis]
MLDKLCIERASSEAVFNPYKFITFFPRIAVIDDDDDEAESSDHFCDLIPRTRRHRPTVAEEEHYLGDEFVGAHRSDYLLYTKSLQIEVFQQSQRFDSEGPYRLLYCSSKGDKEGVIQELDKGVEPNLADYDKRTALHLASCEGRTEVISLLIEKGADVNSTDRWGRTPLSDAHGIEHEEICKILKAHGGIDPMGLDSLTPCYEIDFTEVNMKDGTLIGEGAYGEVYLVKWRGTEVAAKTIRSSIASNEMVKKTFLKELALWQKLRHPNIVQFLGVLRHSNRLIFLTEYLCNGSLYDILRKRGRLDPPTAVAYALDIARGMNYLHQHKPHAIIHRDLTPRNVLQDEAGHLKVTDFGLSKIVQEKDFGYKMTGGTGSFMTFIRSLHGS